ncbi:MAG: FeoA family protein [Gordonibacter sp.]|uniref:FeoA family protein n=1 Tax=Gordonibacter sp. TaxID=1968902 RepID=UPI002FC7A90B
MDNAATATLQSRTREASAASGQARASCHQIPLSFLKNGETAIIAKVRGKGDLHHHLENLGFVEGARITVMTEAAGDLIVEVKGTQVALNKQIASRIITNAAA